MTCYQCPAYLGIWKNATNDLLGNVSGFIQGSRSLGKIIKGRSDENVFVSFTSLGRHIGVRPPKGVKYYSLYPDF